MSIRILHVLESLVAGGIETTFLNVLRSMRTVSDLEGHDILAFGGGLLEPDYRAAADQVHVVAGFEAIDRVLDRKYDVVHVLFERSAARMLPYLLARTGTTVVYGKGYDLAATQRLNDHVTWNADDAMLAACDAVTFTTPLLADGFHLPSGRATILRKAASVRRFSAIPPADAGTPMRVLSVANLLPIKRHADLIRAHSHVRRHVDADLRIVGAGAPEERARLATLAEELGVAASVALVPAHTDIPRELADARVLALASASEGVPTVILEAMAAARPVVATRVGHVASIIDDGVEGFLVDAGDHVALAERITTLLLDAPLARRLGEAGRARAAGHDVSTVAASLIDVLRDARSLA
jgi:glycosyltransferase involved in cell wall biosynthesis